MSDIKGVAREPRVIREWHDEATRQRFRDSGLWGDRTIVEIVDDHAVANPDKLAVADDHVRLTYAELREQSRRVASVLIGLGVKPGDPVAAQLPSCSLIPLLHLAANRIGAVFVPLSTTWRRAEVESLLKVIRPVVFLVPEDTTQFDFVALAEDIRHEVPELQHVLTVRGTGKRSLEKLTASAVPISEEEAVKRRPDPDAPAHVMVSSGSTGIPKASVWGGNDLIATLLHQFQSSIQLVEDDIAAGLAPANTGSTGYVFPVLAPLLAGASTFMLEHWSPQAALDLITREHCTFATAIPTQLVMLLDLPIDTESHSQFTRFNNAGAPLAPSTAADIESRMGCRVQTVYGATDGGIPFMTNIDQPDEGRRSTVGRLLAGEEVKFVDANGFTVPEGEPGEICWRGANKTYGYLNQPDYDALVWDDEGWFHSGDLGQFDPDGNLHIVGRSKDMILRGGTNIFPKEVEELLLTHPVIAAVAVVGVPDARLGEKACAVVVTVGQQEVSLEILVGFLADQGIAKFKMPEHVVRTDSLPLNAGGKVDKDEVRRFAVAEISLRETA